MANIFKHMDPCKSSRLRYFDSNPILDDSNSPKYPDPSKLAILKTKHPCYTGSFTLPLEGPMIPRVLKNMVDLGKFLIFLMAFSIGLPGGCSMAMS